MTPNEMLDALESLLSITEHFAAQMTSEDRREWQRISAETANTRDGDPLAGPEESAA